MSCRRFRGAAAALLVMLVPAALVLTGTESAAASGKVTVVLESVAPASLTAGSTLSVRATVRNSGTAPLDDGTVQLRVRHDRSSTRGSLDDWVQGRTDPGQVELRVPLGVGVLPGGSRTVALDVAADQLRLPSDPFAWGPRGIAVEVLDAGGAPVAVTRSFVVWQGAPGGYEPTRISVVLPLTDGAPDVATGRFPDDRLAELTSSTGRLRAILAAASLPGVTWALDPALLGPDTTTDRTDATAPSESSDGPGPESGEASAPTSSTSPPPADGAGSAEEWRSALQQAAFGHEVVALPYGDPDVNALAHAGQPGLYDLAEQHGRDTVQQLLGVPARTDVAWPVSGTLDLSTLSMLLDAGRSSVLLSGGAHPPAGRVTSTPTGRSRITVGTSSAAGLLVDTPLSATLASVAGGPVPDGTSTPEQQEEDQPLQEAGPAAAVQRLLAETAAITLERPFDPRYLLVAAPRGWAPERAAAVAAVQALTTAPWLEAHPLGDLIDTEPADLDRAPLRYPESDRDGELPASGLQTAAAALDRIRTTSTVLPDPDRVLGAAERSAAAAASAAWRDRLVDWKAQVAQFAAAALARETAVSALPGSGVTVVSSNVSLPVTLQNTLAQDARVQVRLRPRTSRLVVDNTELGIVTVPAHSQRRFSVPVQAVGNGNTDVGVQVLTPTGQALGQPVIMTVRVRADWESRGTLVIGVLVGLVLLVGVVRSVLRGRRS